MTREGAKLFIDKLFSENAQDVENIVSAGIGKEVLREAFMEVILGSGTHEPVGFFNYDKRRKG